MQYRVVQWLSHSGYAVPADSFVYDTKDEADRAAEKRERATAWQTPAPRYWAEECPFKAGDRVVLACPDDDDVLPLGARGTVTAEIAKDGPFSGMLLVSWDDYPEELFCHPDDVRSECP